ncbi:hypothetical protein CDL15_Pgr009064 [Punica granatum]|uniref:Uncharacterized protein n=1 Tax=Punica granatum TaxID=22663 RepID=A0A218VY51_PUNGR|nr:hypothetical protein CDL15_Pgr009064 [Punica granatum]
MTATAPPPLSFLPFFFFFFTAVSPASATLRPPGMCPAGKGGTPKKKMNDGYGDGEDDDNWELPEVDIDIPYCSKLREAWLDQGDEYCLRAGEVFGEGIIYFSHVLSQEIRCYHLEAPMAYYVYWMWQERNSIVFKKVAASVSSLVKKFVYSISEKVLVLPKVKFKIASSSLAVKLGMRAID